MVCMRNNWSVSLADNCLYSTDKLYKKLKKLQNMWHGFDEMSTLKISSWGLLSKRPDGSVVQRTEFTEQIICKYDN